MRTRLLNLHSQLAAHFAHEPHWWPIITDDPPFEVVVGMVLVQQTRWQTVEATIRRMIERGWMSPQGLLTANTNELAQLVRPCAFHNQKAPGLQSIARYVVERYDGDTAALLARETSSLRTELLALPRVGRETADTIMLYGGGHPVPIIDAYARRILGRAGLPTDVDLFRAPYDVVRSVLLEALNSGPAPELSAERCLLPGFIQPRSPLTVFFWDFHALLVEASIHHCLATRMYCDTRGQRPSFVDTRKCAAHCVECVACPLSTICATHQI